jgi:cellulose synthase/poly-beta-1,6-N-acetylglucosamine synthase-like glycosyltransferase
VKGYAAQMDMRVKIFHHEWQGLGYSRNIVVNNADGDLIIWVDGDMILTKSFVRKLVEFMEANPKVAIAKGMQGILNIKSLAVFLENVLFLAYDFEEKHGHIKRLPGTGGSIYRLKAIRNVGGFDNNIKGACEDIDMAYRIIINGWLVKKAPAIFYERYRQTWKELWDEYYWMGEGMYVVLRKHPRIIDLYKMLPLGGFIAGIIYSVKAYKIINKKVVFLLPFHFTFKFTAWCLGFLNRFLNL